MANRYDRVRMSFYAILAFFLSALVVVPMCARAQNNDPMAAFATLYTVICLLSIIGPIIIGTMCTAWIYLDGKKRVIYRKNYWYLCIALGLLGIFISPVFSVVGVVLWFVFRDKAQQPEYLFGGYPGYYPPPMYDPYSPYGQYYYPLPPYYAPPGVPPTEVNGVKDAKEANDADVNEGKNSNAPQSAVPNPAKANQNSGPKESCKTCYRPFDKLNATCATCTKL